MIVSRDEARRIASLARIAMDDASLDRMAVEMTTILDYIDQLREIDVPRAMPDAPVASPLRDDVPGGDGAVVATIAQNAPAWQDGFFIVPKVIGDE